jgi:hypothetical protein
MTYTELNRHKDILHDLGYLRVYLTMYLKNTGKQDNLENIKEYINYNQYSWLRKGHRL